MAYATGARREELLDPIYAAIDARNYKGAYKTSHDKKVLVCGPIVLALRGFVACKLDKFDEALECVLDVMDVDRRATPQAVVENVVELFSDTIVLTTIGITSRSLPLKYQLNTAGEDLLGSLYSKLLKAAGDAAIPVPEQILSLNFEHSLRAHIMSEHSNLSSISQISRQLYKVTNTTTHLYTAATLLCLQFKNAQEDDKGRAMLPKLAGALLAKAGDDAKRSHQDHLCYVTALQLDGQHEKILDYLAGVATADGTGNIIDDEQTLMNSTNSVLPLSPLDRDDLRISSLVALKRHDEAIEVLKTILQANSDSWVHWSQLFDCCVALPNGTEALATNVVSLADEIIVNETVKMRGPRLIKLKVACHCLESGVELGLKVVVDQYIAYYSAFNKLGCCVDDLGPTTAVLSSVEEETPGALEILQTFMQFERSDSRYVEGINSDTHKKNLRRYITCTRLLTKVFKTPPCVEYLMEEYVESLRLSGEVSEQREVRAGDEIVEIVAESMLAELESMSDTSEKTAQLLRLMSILQKASNDSPYNYKFSLFLTLVSILLGSPLTALIAWNKLEVKQIQLDSLTYRLLDGLNSMACYEEGSSLCADLIGMHRHAKHSVAEAAGVAFNRGNYKQGVDMIEFQKCRMDNSLSLLDAKGRQIALAPLSDDVLGAVDGLCGGASDSERADRMLDSENLEKYGYGALFDYDWTADLEKTVKLYSDNRDLTVLASSINVSTTEAIVEQAGVNLVIQKVLLAAVAICGNYKPPKKGKLNPGVVKAGEDIASKLTVAETVMRKYAVNNPGNSAGAKMWSVMKAVVDAISAMCVSGGEDPAKVAIELSISNLAELREVLLGPSSTPFIGGALYNVAWLNQITANLPMFLVPLCAAVAGAFKIGKKKKTVRVSELKEALVALFNDLKAKLEEVGKSKDAAACVAALFGEQDEKKDIVAACASVLEGSEMTKDRVVKIMSSMCENLELIG